MFVAFASLRFMARKRQAERVKVLFYFRPRIVDAPGGLEKVEKSLCCVGVQTRRKAAVLNLNAWLLVIVLVSGSSPSSCYRRMAFPRM